MTPHSVSQRRVGIHAVLVGEESDSARRVSQRGVTYFANISMQKRIFQQKHFCMFIRTLVCSSHERKKCQKSCDTATLSQLNNFTNSLLKFPCQKQGILLKFEQGEIGCVECELLAIFPGCQVQQRIFLVFPTVKLYRFHCIKDGNS